MNCRVCGRPFFAGRTVFHCSCGVITHAHCWHKHVAESHAPPFTVGTITLNGGFVLKETPSKPALTIDESHLLVSKQGSE
jgi:hypothetical protein